MLKEVLEKWQPVLLNTLSDKQKGTEDIAGGKVVYMESLAFICYLMF